MLPRSPPLFLLPILFTLFGSCTYAHRVVLPDRPGAPLGARAPFEAELTVTTVMGLHRASVPRMLAGADEASKEATDDEGKAGTVDGKGNGNGSVTVWGAWATVCAIPLYANSTSNSNSSSSLLLGTSSPSTLISSSPALPTATATTTSPSNSLATIGPNNCTTLLTSTVTAICSTVLSGMGQLPITVTDCGQTVTFSTEGACPLAAGTTTSTSVLMSAATASSMMFQTFYLAAWGDVAAGSVPRDVLGKVCDCGDEEDETAEEDGGNVNCETRSELWTVVTATRTVARLQTVRFEGVVSGPATLILGNGVFTTSIPGSGSQNVSVDATVTASSSVLVPRISKSIITALSTTTAASETGLLGTSTSVVTVTYTVYEVGQTTVIQTSTATQVSTVTVKAPSNYNLTGG